MAVEIQPVRAGTKDCRHSVNLLHDYSEFCDVTMIRDKRYPGSDARFGPPEQTPSASLHRREAGERENVRRSATRTSDSAGVSIEVGKTSGRELAGETSCTLSCDAHCRRR